MALTHLLYHRKLVQTVLFDRHLRSICIKLELAAHQLVDFPLLFLPLLEFLHLQAVSFFIIFV